MSNTRIRIGFAAFALALAATAQAQERGCIELQNTAEVEQEYVNEHGQKARRLVPAASVVPGSEVIYTVTARNVCAQPADNIVIANPVPEHMRFVANSAMGMGTEISYSLDGKVFDAAERLQVKAADGSTRLATADEYRAVRWVFKHNFAPGAVAFVRYRAALN